MKKLFKYLAIIYLVVQCSPSKPLYIHKGEKNCEFCKMNIQDLRFHSEYINQKGKIFHFDSIECAIQWSVENNIDNHSLWIRNYLNENLFLNEDEFVIIQSEKIKSPMGMGLVAISKMEPTNFIQEAKKLELFELIEFVKNFKKKEK